jgi:diguanylate cyclase (GGDEF)-like protein
MHWNVSLGEKVRGNVFYIAGTLRRCVPAKFVRWIESFSEWTKIETMKKLVDLISTNDAGEIFEHIHAMVALVERNGVLISWNRAFESYKVKHPLAETLQDCFTQKEKTIIQGRLDDNHQDQFVVELGTDDEAKTVFCDCVLIPLADGRVLFIAERFDTGSLLQEVIHYLNRQVNLFQTESESAKKNVRNKQIEVDAIVAQVHELSHIDALTFLPNRRMIVRELQDEILRAQRYNTPLSISMADIDLFKKVNDTYGHLVGDEVLRHVAHLLRDHIRHPDITGRYGGEEFLILLPNTVSAEAAGQAARLCQYVRETSVNVKNLVLNVTISIGVAQFQNGVDTWETLLNRADTAMYEAKNSGRDGVMVAK